MLVLTELGNSAMFDSGSQMNVEGRRLGLLYSCWSLFCFGFFFVIYETSDATEMPTKLYILKKNMFNVVPTNDFYECKSSSPDIVVAVSVFHHQGEVVNRLRNDVTTIFQLYL